MEADTKIHSEVAQDFSLRKIAHLLEEYVPPPAEGFDPAGDWQQRYTMFVIQPNAGVKKGGFLLERQAKGARDFLLTVRTRRLGNSGFSQFQHAEMQCRSDLLATPVSWIFDTKMAHEAADPPYLLSGRRRSANVAGGILLVRDTLRISRTMMPGPYSNEWTLLEAIQRMPGRSMQEVEYTLIDEYDTPQPGHRLSYRTQAQVTFQSGPAQLTAFCDLGRALVPTVYWVDEHHRLIFVCTGLMVYALTETNGRSGSCPNHYPAYSTEA